jgi:hypothetical protein
VARRGGNRMDVEINYPILLSVISLAFSILSVIVSAFFIGKIYGLRESKKILNSIRGTK